MAEYLEVIDAIEEMENNGLNERPGRIIRDRLNPMESFSDEVFLNRFRFPKQIALDLLNEILLTNEFNDPQGKINSVPVLNQLLLTMHFYPLSCFLRTDGDVFGVSKSSCSRIIKKCSAAIASLKPKYVTFPHDDEINSISHTCQILLGP